MILWFLSTCWLHFFLIQPRKALAVFAIRVQCLFMFNSLLTSTPRQSCPLAGWPCHVAWGYSVPDTALCICFCWTLRFLWVCFSRLLQSLWIALSSGVLVTIPALLVSSANLLGGVLCLIMQAINSDVRWYWCQYWSLRDAITNWTPAGVHIADHNPWSPAVQAIFHPPYSLLIQLISHWFG